MFYNDLMFATNSYPNSNPNFNLVLIVLLMFYLKYSVFI